MLLLVSAIVPFTFTTTLSMWWFSSVSPMLAATCIAGDPNCSLQPITYVCDHNPCSVSQHICLPGICIFDNTQPNCYRCGTPPTTSPPPPQGGPATGAAAPPPPIPTPPIDKGPVCGNGIREGMEECDDANVDRKDGCHECKKIEYCCAAEPETCSPVPKGDKCPPGQEGPFDSWLTCTLGCHLPPDERWYCVVAGITGGGECSNIDTKCSQLVERPGKDCKKNCSDNSDFDTCNQDWILCMDCPYLPGGHAGPFETIEECRPGCASLFGGIEGGTDGRPTADSLGFDGCRDWPCPPNQEGNLQFCHFAPGPNGIPDTDDTLQCLSSCAGQCKPKPPSSQAGPPPSPPPPPPSSTTLPPDDDDQPKVCSKKQRQRCRDKKKCWKGGKYICKCEKTKNKKHFKCTPKGDGGGGQGIQGDSGQEDQCAMCGSCGQGAFNLCDEQECKNLGNCGYVPGFPVGSCGGTAPQCRGDTE